MGLFDFLRGPDIHQGVEEWKAISGAVLLDVRTTGEYAGGHIPGSRNVPLDSLAQVNDLVEDKSTPIFVHCFSGSRSRQATAILQQMGYGNVKNIGGISAWRGEVER